MVKNSADELQRFGNIPVDSIALYDIAKGYMSQRNKISSMETRGDIIRLRQGLYVVSSKISREPISRELIANHLYGPSYVSFETALLLYGMIPKKPFNVRSASIKHSRLFENAIGRFEHLYVAADYYPIGIRRHVVKNKYAYLVATPEKALCDQILSMQNARLHSVRNMQIYLKDKLHLTLPAPGELDMDVVRKCVETGNRARLNALLEYLNELGY
ncbi:MAG: hypothetical protein LBG30_06975 [Odoribacteraceae bacterium]|jgi:hypothetical protein|nr:hypothetical protein [Odoribacteraceae bacterium]